MALGMANPLRLIKFLPTCPKFGKSKAVIYMIYLKCSKGFKLVPQKLLIEVGN